MKQIIPLFVYFNYNTNSSEPFYTGSKWSGFIQLSANERYVAYVNRSGTWSDSIWSRSDHGNARVVTIVRRDHPIGFFFNEITYSQVTEMSDLLRLDQTLITLSPEWQKVDDWHAAMGRRAELIRQTEYASAFIVIFCIDGQLFQNFNMRLCIRV